MRKARGNTYLRTITVSLCYQAACMLEQPSTISVQRKPLSSHWLCHRTLLLFYRTNILMVVRLHAVFRVLVADECAMGCVGCSSLFSYSRSRMGSGFSKGPTELVFFLLIASTLHNLAGSHLLASFDCDSENSVLPNDLGNLLAYFFFTNQPHTIMCRSLSTGLLAGTMLSKVLSRA